MVRSNWSSEQLLTWVNSARRRQCIIHKIWLFLWRWVPFFFFNCVHLRLGRKLSQRARPSKRVVGWRNNQSLGKDGWDRVFSACSSSGRENRFTIIIFIPSSDSVFDRKVCCLIEIKWLLTWGKLHLFLFTYFCTLVPFIKFKWLLLLRRNS